MGSNVVNIEATTPVVSKLKKLLRRKIYSFHALPISCQGSSDIITEQDTESYGKYEFSIAGDEFDNFFFPKKVIRQSQLLTSKLYNSDSTFYITGGTCVANQIAISALFKQGSRILIDKNCHQSVHFYLQSIGAKVDYLCSDLQAENGQIRAWSYNMLENKILDLQRKGEVYDLVVFPAQSYEGLIYDVPGILTKLLAAGVKTRKFFIDEAWGGLNYFSEDTKPYTAMNIAQLINYYPDLEVICTQSAHKSMFCLRQASLIHCRGNHGLAERIETAKYRIHTTSPNYPILASLDNSQAQMAIYGSALAAYSRKLASYFKEEISNITELSGCNIPDNVFSEHWHIHCDPTKIFLNVSCLGKAEDIKNQLFKKSIYVNRTINDNLLFNFHIGINKNAVKSLISALTEISVRKMSSIPSVSEKFIIPYPPGVPLVFPGEIITNETKEKIALCKKKGLMIIAA
ncbi:hypothetical protein [Vagococcus sp. WN89Y]|uniref:Orn/Lys/Arg family decarboxylase n=1 Tax=Vagococcus sp. WN89Y TaxID=3457258 RepID=UPI003FCD5ED2